MLGFVVLGLDELYAKSCAPTSTIEVEDESATIVARAESRRPVRFQVQESTDLITWLKAAVISISASRDSIVAGVAKSPGEDAKFVRAVAKRIPVDER